MKFKNYNIKFILLSIGMLLTIFLINICVDPLWYFKGNIIQPFNLSFNERITKTNLYMQNPKQYDCIVLGSSVTTLLDETHIEGYHCFNFSFSAGNVQDFISFLKYVKKYGVYPKLVVVGVDHFNFMDFELIDTSPDYIKNLELPPNALSSYLSYDALNFSIRSLLHQFPRLRNYDQDFKGVFLNPEVYYDPNNPIRFPLYGQTKPLDSKNIIFYKYLRNIFPEAKYIGYVPLKGIWETKKFFNSGYLNKKLSVIYDVSIVFDQFYDCSYYNDLIVRTDNTYDAFHYLPKANDLVIKDIFGDKQNHCLKLDNLTKEQYTETYTNALKSYRN